MFNFASSTLFSKIMTDASHSVTQILPIAISDNELCHCQHQAPVLYPILARYEHYVTNLEHGTPLDLRASQSPFTYSQAHLTTSDL